MTWSGGGSAPLGTADPQPVAQALSAAMLPCPRPQSSLASSRRSAALRHTRCVGQHGGVPGDSGKRPCLGTATIKPLLACVLACLFTCSCLASLAPLQLPSLAEGGMLWFTDLTVRRQHAQQAQHVVLCRARALRCGFAEQPQLLFASRPGG